MNMDEHGFQGFTMDEHGWTRIRGWHPFAAKRLKDPWSSVGIRGSHSIRRQADKFDKPNKNPWLP